MIRNLFYLIAVFCFTANLSYSQETTPTQTEKQKVIVAPSDMAANVVKLIEGKVTDVFDGDTLNVESKDRKIYAIRMLGVDAPEDKQTFAAQSKKKLADLIKGKQVTVLVKKMDSFNRYVGSVYFKGKDINLRQIETGMAWHHAPYAYDQRADDRQAYIEAEQKARAEKIGLWKDENPQPPWEYGSAKNTQEISNQDKKAEEQTVAPIVTIETEVKAETPTNPKTQSDKKYIRGSRGGCYYINSYGNKTYVDRNLCN